MKILTTHKIYWKKALTSRKTMGNGKKIVQVRDAC